MDRVETNQLVGDIRDPSTLLRCISDMIYEANYLPGHLDINLGIPSLKKNCHRSFSMTLFFCLLGGYHIQRKFR